MAKATTPKNKMERVRTALDARYPVQLFVQAVLDAEDKPRHVGKVVSLNLFFFLYAFCSLAFAVRPEIDRNLPIHIQSDKATFQQTTGLATYEGNVIMRQGSHKLQANKLTIQKKENSSVITAVGSPATFDGQLSGETEPVYATAKIIYYYPEKQLITLEGSATLEHKQDKFRGPILNYEIEKQVVSAKSQNNERPTITLHPQVSRR